ncbi:S8 family peptidase [Anaerocolumna sp. AGMB13025]|uniref:S8 family peptidase n=1 Tax=Anaerocolumna sp. AGMB13025 TaxID=3039116 RepID=UPI00241D4E0D|nr:S8 family peptidase [Anaerocolumna sp. AGMB13025]WFR55615.1 S8 family peptidase [Anaerocolumna sp. AGMB13025]
MFKRRIFYSITAICLSVLFILSSILVLNQKASAEDKLSDVYNSSNYENPYAKDRIIVALKSGADNQLNVVDQGLTYQNKLSEEDSNYDVVLYTIKDQSAEGVIDAINSLKENPAVVYAEPDYYLKAVDTVPNDPNYSNLYGLKKISAPTAWDTYTGAKNVVVGVIDSGIQYTHTDLANNIWVNPGEIQGNGIDDDKNGYIDDIYGWNFVDNNNKPLDDNGHGTHVAGTIGAVGNNGIGVVGVNWNTQLAALKFLDADGGGYTSDAILAINYAKNKGFAVTNNSWGGGSFSQSLKDAIDSYSGLFVAAAGNDGTNNDSRASYPASYTSANIIAVAATTSTDAKASYSNYGSTSVDLGAPGDAIFSTYLNNGYATASGTSMAAPHVSGAVALLKSFNPSLTSAQIKSAILSNVDKISSLNGRTVTGGRLNVAKSLNAIK